MNVNAVPEAVAEAAREELARRELLPFAARCFVGWQNAKHLDLIADLLQQVERGEIKRLIVNLPPRHGKSLLCSSIFPAWYLGRHPRKNAVITTHSAELSERNSRICRALVQDRDRWPFEAKLSGDSTSASRWNLGEGGGVYACSVGSSITGRGADILIGDDLLHDSLGSDGELDAAWKWFTEVAIPRLEPRGSIILIGTRFSQSDVFGRLLDGPDADKWTVVKLPAICDSEDDLLHRPIGSALWPARMDVTELEARKREMGSRAYACQFQQNPVPLEGNLIKAEWLQYYDTAPKSFEKVVCALDAASSTTGDYSALVKIGVSKNAFYVLDVWRDKVEFPALLKRVVALEGETPKPSSIYCESASNAIALIQTLKQSTRLPVVGVPAKGSKVSRVEASVTGVMEAKKVYLPNDAPWLLDFERELLSFPAGKHCDMVDAFTLALSQLSGKRMSKNFWFTFGGNGPDEHYFGPDDHSPEREESVPTMGSVSGALTRLGL
jgi:predicted phage terminase large subunit-like protein